MRNMKMCNCRKPTECPLEGRCLEQCLIYKATVSSNSSSKYYIGSTGQSFKSRYTAYKLTLKKQQQSSETSLSKHIWHLSEKQTSYTIKWELWKSASSINVEQENVTYAWQKNCLYWTQIQDYAWTRIQNCYKNADIWTNISLQN